jgi:hypothetical protein
MPAVVLSILAIKQAVGVALDTASAADSTITPEDLHSNVCTVT